MDTKSVKTETETVYWDGVDGHPRFQFPIYFGIYWDQYLRENRTRKLVHPGILNRSNYDSMFSVTPSVTAFWPCHNKRHTQTLYQAYVYVHFVARKHVPYPTNYDFNQNLKLITLITYQGMDIAYTRFMWFTLLPPFFSIVDLLQDM